MSITTTAREQRRTRTLDDPRIAIVLPTLVAAARDDI